jgi:iron complex transport system substrate-binding protein
VEQLKEQGLSNNIPKSQAQRIVSLAPSITEMLVQLHLTDKLVGVTVQCQFSEVIGCADVGSFIAPEFDHIAALKPNLVVGLERTHRRLLAAVEAEISPVLAVKTASVADILQGMDDLAVLVANSSETASVVTALRKRVADVSLQVSGRRPVRVVRISKDDPITVPTPCSHQYDALRLAGGAPLTVDGSDGEPYAAITLDELRAFDPEVILSCGFSRGQPPKARCARCKRPRPQCQRMVEDIATWDGWQEISAVRNGWIYPVACHRLCRPGPSVVAGIELIASHLHPAESL